MTQGVAADLVRSRATSATPVVIGVALVALVSALAGLDAVGLLFAGALALLLLACEWLLYRRGRIA